MGAIGQRDNVVAATLVGLIVATVLSAGPASAHARLVRMVPTDGSTVRIAPPAVQLIFQGTVQPRYDLVVVTAPNGTRVSTGAPQVTGSVVRQALAPLTAAGRYAVAYRLTAADGHLISRQLSFHYSPTAGASAGQVPATAPPSPGPGLPKPLAGAPAGGRNGVWAGVALAALLLAGAGTAVWHRRRRPE